MINRRELSDRCDVQLSFMADNERLAEERISKSQAKKLKRRLKDLKS